MSLVAFFLERVITQPIESHLQRDSHKIWASNIGPPRLRPIDTLTDSFGSLHHHWYQVVTNVGLTDQIRFVTTWPPK